MIDYLKMPISRAARLVLSGGKEIDEFPAVRRARIAAEVARLQTVVEPSDEIARFREALSQVKSAKKDELEAFMLSAFGVDIDKRASINHLRKQVIDAINSKLEELSKNEQGE
jgi:hypothetical protein